MSKKNILLLIIVVGFLIRTTIWFFGYGPERLHAPMTNNSSPFTVIASSFDPSSSASFFAHPHAIYFVYPLYLSPAYIFGLNLESYVFWLHQLFTALTIILIYLSALKIGGINAGLLAALVYACQLQIAFLFDRAWPIAALHFQLALFMYCCLICWERASPKHVLLCVITGLMLPFTRPEGAIFPAVSLMIFAFRFINPRLGVMRTLAVCLAPILLVLLSGIYVLNQNKEVRETVFSHYHVGLIYLGTRDIPLGYMEVNDHIESRQSADKVCADKARQDPEGRSMWYWCTVTGLETISNDPLNYLFVSAKRLFDQLYPSFFRYSQSWKYKLVDRSNMSFIIMGVVFIFLFNIKGKFEMISLVLMALACYIGLSFTAHHWEVIMELTPQVLLFPVASVGWVRLANLTYERFLQSETSPNKNV